MSDSVKAIKKNTEKLTERIMMGGELLIQTEWQGSPLW